MRDLPDFSNARVLVVGDLMLDSYWHGATSRVSPEAPVPVVHVQDDEARPGGAGNVALNIAALGARVKLLGLVGDDEAGKTLESQLSAAGVEPHFLVDAIAPTITKLRVISRHQQLIRLDFEDGFSGAQNDALQKTYLSLLDDADVVVLSDYAKGTLDEVATLISVARDADKPVLVDPKGNEFSRYSGATLITPNLAEFEAVAGASADDEDFKLRAETLIDQCQLDYLLVTRGEHGMDLLASDREHSHMPTRAREVFDVTGAGDTVIAVLAAGLAAGLKIQSATQLANMAAGIVVGKLGTATTSGAELEQSLWEHRAEDHGVVSEQQLLESVRVARARGESVVMTNGCFDILHPGHVSYLQEASQLGDRLIVAVNIDETVRQLKGEGRPVNPVEARMAVLAALGCVDWVVPFVEETPERLICAVAPDLLVKGGDNDPDKIPGAGCVREQGGEVRALGFVQGVSTTRIVESIKDQ
ncbi:MAG: bifunctional D-glycero-beta-D-manno-heptose-7-phosphate kinase/D-glycero-beta-D-manno-heptose 1-phosphate adenylyltransferase HldE [bacterium]